MSATYLCAREYTYITVLKVNVALNVIRASSRAPLLSTGYIYLTYYISTDEHTPSLLSTLINCVQPPQLLFVCGHVRV